MPKILFICTGNYFRSRFAEAWFNHRAEEEGLAWQAFSRGFYPHLAPPGISPHTARAVEELGVAPQHVAPDKVKLAESDLVEATLVVAMKESEHRPYFERHYPEWTEKIQYWEAHDIDVQPPVQGLVAIRLQVDRLIAAIQSKK